MRAPAALLEAKHAGCSTNTPDTTGGSYSQVGLLFCCSDQPSWCRCTQASPAVSLRRTWPGRPVGPPACLRPPKNAYSIVRAGMKVRAAATGRAASIGDTSTEALVAALLAGKIRCIARKLNSKGFSQILVDLKDVRAFAEQPAEGPTNLPDRSEPASNLPDRSEPGFD